MAQQGFLLTSPTFRNGEFLPASSTCDGEGVSPALSWRNAPPGVCSFVVVLEDQDAQPGPFTHWLLFDVPAGRDGLEAAAQGIATAGRNGFHHTQYGAPCPAPNHGQHRYRFLLYALDVETLGLQEGASREAVEQAMMGHELDRAELMARYERRTH